MRRSGTGSVGFCDWIGHQALRCWVGLGFYQTLLSDSWDNDSLTLSFDWVDRSTREIDSIENKRKSSKPQAKWKEISHNVEELGMLVKEKHLD